MSQQKGIKLKGGRRAIAAMYIPPNSIPEIFGKAQRHSTPITTLSMVHFESGTKLALLVDVFEELRLTHW